MTEIRRCPNCGAEYPDNANYCPKCDMFVGTSSYIHEAPDVSEYDKAREHQKSSDEIIRQKLLEKHRHEENKLRAAKEAAAKTIHVDDEATYLESTKNSSEEHDDRLEEKETLQDEMPREVLIEKTIEEVLPQEKAIQTAKVTTFEKQPEPVIDEENISIASKDVPEKDPELFAKEPSTNEVLPQKKNNKKKWWTILAVLLLAGSGISYSYYRDMKKEAASELSAKENKQKTAALSKKVHALYTDDNQQFLGTQVTEKTLDDLIVEITMLPETEQQRNLLAEAKHAQNKYKQVSDLNNLFETPILSGDDLNKSAVLKETIEKITLADLDETNLFATNYNQGLAIAKEQLKMFSTAKEAVLKVIKDEKLVKDTTRSAYDKANKLVSELKNDTLKDTLQDSLKIADSLLATEEAETAKKIAEQTKKEQEIKEAQTAEKNTQQTVENTASAVEVFGQDRVNQWQAKNPTVQTGSLSNLEAGVESSDPWVWAPGVQAAVLNECFRRGYIVEGGYSLERISVENGEGYYGLYATNNQSPLMQEMGEVQTPFYILKINCKTGWFRGTGADATLP